MSEPVAAVEYPHWWSQGRQELAANGLPPDMASDAIEDAEHATALAMPIPHMVAVVAPPNAPLRRVEEWAKRKSTHPAILVGAARGARWEIGEQVDPCMVTEAAYDAAVAFAENPYAFANPPPKKTEP